MLTDVFLATGLQALFYVVTLVFVIYSVFITYHWFVYGSSKSLSMLSLAVYLLGSTPFFLIMAVALSLLTV